MIRVIRTMVLTNARPTLLTEQCIVAAALREMCLATFLGTSGVPVLSSPLMWLVAVTVPDFGDRKTMTVVEILLPRWLAMEQLLVFSLIPVTLPRHRTLLLPR